MQNMKTKTTVITEFAGMGLKSDGTWRKITATHHKAAGAQEWLDNYIAEVNRYPDLYTKYAEYKVMKRVVIASYEDWGEV